LSKRFVRYHCTALSGHKLQKRLSSKATPRYVFVHGLIALVETVEACMLAVTVYTIAHSDTLLCSCYRNNLTYLLTYLLARLCGDSFVCGLPWRHALAWRREVGA